MTRRQDWPERLFAFIESHRSVPFAWGSNDCALFAADWTRDATGRDPGAAFRGRYSTAKGAERALRKWGAGDLVSTWTALEGEPLRSPKLAQRGDVVAIGEGLAVHLGDRIVGMTTEGLCFLSPLSAEIAWRV